GGCRRWSTPGRGSGPTWTGLRGTGAEAGGRPPPRGGGSGLPSPAPGKCQRGRDPPPRPPPRAGGGGKANGGGGPRPAGVGAPTLPSPLGGGVGGGVLDRAPTFPATPSARAARRPSAPG